MAANEEYVIDIMVNVADNTRGPLTEAQKDLTAFERDAQQSARRMQALTRTPFDMTIRAVDKASSVMDRVSSKGLSMVRRPYELSVRVKDMATAPLRGIMNLATSYQAFMVAGAATAAGGAAIAWPLKLADNLTQANISFQTMLGSAQKATQFMQQVQNFAAATPFSTQQTVSNAQYLLSQGWQQKQVIPVLQTVGDSISASGGNLNDIRNVLMALSQMRANGRVDAQDMDQLINANLPAWQLLAESMHTSVSNVRQQSQAGKIASGPAVQAILTGLEKRYGGAMNSNANKTVGGVMSQIWSVVSTNLATPWGQGLQQGILPDLQKMNDWLTKNQNEINKIGSALRDAAQNGAQWLMNKVQSVGQTIQTMTKGPAWQNADGFWGKMKVGWDTLVVTPFNIWWAGKGKQEVQGIASSVGKFFGDMLNGAASSLFSLASGNKGGNQSAFVSAGQSAGSAFFNAFAKAFDAGKLADKAKGAFSNIQPWNQQTTTGKLFGTGVDVAGILLALSLLGKGAGALKTGTSAFGWLFGTGGKAATVASDASTATKGTSALSSASRFLEQHPLLGKSAQALKRVGRFGALNAGLSAFEFLTADSAKGKGQAIGSGIGGWGGAAAGAAAGAALGSVVPIVGTVIGGVLGSIVGGLGGNWLGKWAGGDIGSLFAKHASQPTMYQLPSLNGQTVGSQLYAPGVKGLYGGAKVYGPPAPQKTTQEVKQTVSVNAGGIAFNITVNGTNGSDVVDAIKQHAPEVSDIFAYHIAKSMEQFHSNAPIPAPR